jgi:hypothetical protein
MGILARAFLPGQGRTRRATSWAREDIMHHARSHSRASLGDLKVVPGPAVMLAANTVSTEIVH